MQRESRRQRAGGRERGRAEGAGCVKVWLNGALTVPVVVAGLVTVMALQAMTEGVGRARAGAAVGVRHGDDDRERAVLRRSCRRGRRRREREAGRQRARRCVKVAVPMRAASA